MPNAHYIEGIVALLYEAAVSDEAAARLARAFQDAFQAGSASVWTLDGRSGALADVMLTTLPQEAQAQYASHFCALDPWSAAASRRGLAEVALSGELVDEATYARSLFYADFGRPFDVFHSFGAMLPLDERRRGVFAITRPRSLPAFDEADRAAMQCIAPHFRRALQLRATLSAERAAGRLAAAGLDALRTAAVLTDGAGCVVFANLAAEAADRTGSGLALGQRGSGVSARTPAATARLLALVADAARGGPGGWVRLAARAGGFVCACVHPAPDRLAPGGAAGSPCRVLILLQADPPPACDDVERSSRELFGLTASEAGVVGLLVQGFSPAEVAERRGLRITTVRTLIRRALDKTDAASLRELVARLVALRPP